MELEARATDLLQRLIRHNTVNPPGNELAVQTWLAGQLTAAGFEVEMVAADEQRPNLVATLRGDEPGPVLGLLSHVDTVLAEPERWTHDPWSGDLIDGDVWGRGAQDMKSQTAAEVAAAIDLAKSGWRPARGALKVIAVADEENGSALGANWLCAEHPDLARCDYLINEGAGALMPVAGRDYYGICTAEKGVAAFTVTVTGRPGHGSMPGLADNPVPKLAPVLAALASAKPQLDITEAPQRLLETLGAADLEALAQLDPLMALFAEPMLSVTFAPTMLDASPQINVIPAQAGVHVDCRTPPGFGRELVEQRLAEVLAGVDVEYDVTFTKEPMVGNSSPTESPLMDALARWTAAESPDTTLLPLMLPAYTDSRVWRDTFPECVAYGFFPQRVRNMYEAWPLVHGIDERIAASDVGLAARCYKAVALDLLG